MPTSEAIAATSTAPVSPEGAAAIVQRAVAALGLVKRSLTTKQRMHGLKFRKGAEPHIRVVGHMSLQFGVTVPGSPTAGMLASLVRAGSLHTLRLALVGALAQVDDAIAREEGAAYATALTLYGMLKKVGHRHEEVRAGLESVSAFFSYRHPSVAAAARAKTAEASDPGASA